MEVFDKRNTTRIGICPAKVELVQCFVISSSTEHFSVSHNRECEENGLVIFHFLLCGKVFGIKYSSK